MESKIRCYRISGHYGYHQFEETTYSPTQARAESNVRWRIHNANGHIPIGEIIVTKVEILSKGTNKFERITERIS